MMPGRISGRRTRRRKRDLPGKLARSSASAASKPRVSDERDAAGGDDQAVDDGIPDGGVGEKLAVPIEGEMARRKTADAVAIEGVEDQDGDRQVDEGEDERGVGRESRSAAGA